MIEKKTMNFSDFSSNCYQEVFEVLSNMKKTDVMSIPIELLQTIKNKRNKKFVTRIDRNDLFNEKNISIEAMDFLCWLYFNYLIEKKEQNKLLNYYYMPKNEFNYNELFNKNIFQNISNEEQTNINIYQKKKTFIEKIKIFIFKILCKDRE